MQLTDIIMHCLLTQTRPSLLRFSSTAHSSRLTAG